VPLHQLNLYQITMLNEFPEKCQTKKVCFSSSNYCYI
jgi:hypothetical protein